MLKTRRLTIRPMRQEDAPDLHRFFSDATAMRYFDNVHETRAETDSWVRRAVEGDPATTREFSLLLNGAVIGKAGIWARPELGFFLVRDAWGQGLMREALEILIPHLFSEMGLSKMTADVDPQNGASLTLLSSLGFVETGRAAATIEIGGTWCDSVYLALKPPPEPPAQP